MNIIALDRLTYVDGLMVRWHTNFEAGGKTYDDQVSQGGDVVLDTAGSCRNCGICGGPDAPPNSNPAAGCEGYGHPIFLDADAWTPSRRQYLDPVGAVSVGGFRRDGARQLLLEEGLRSENPLKLSEPASGREAGSPPRRLYMRRLYMKQDGQGPIR
jgi:hypothetical protein